MQPHHALRVVGIARDSAGEMEHAVDTRQRGIELGPVEHVAAHVLHAEPREHAAARAREPADRVARLDEHATQMLAEKAGRAGDEIRAHAFASSSGLTVLPCCSIHSAIGIVPASPSVQV
jgi:hypothetical protein